MLGAVSSLARRLRHRAAFLLIPVALPVVALLAWSLQPPGPTEVVEGYLRSVYAGDYARAYDFISLEDQRYKTRAEYVADLSDQPVTAKAYHSVEPVRWDLPEGVESVRNHYDFYPIETFPTRVEDD